MEPQQQNLSLGQQPAFGPPQQTLFLPSVAGKILVTHFKPRANVYAGRDVLFIPPLAEEMNKARRMVAQQAHQLAAHGIGMVVPDLFGTGDSDGDFEDARLSIWIQDILATLSWLRGQGSSQIDFLALRAGTLLAAQLLRTDPALARRLVLWAPVLNGEAMMTEFLRLRTVSRLTGTQQPKESTKDLRAQLSQNGKLEVAGYMLNAELYEALNAMRIEALVTRGFPPIRWLELVNEPTQPMPLPKQALIHHWECAGIDVLSEKVVGQPFWTGKAITVVQALLETTTALLCDGGSK